MDTRAHSKRRTRTWMVALALVVVAVTLVSGVASVSANALHRGGRGDCFKTLVAGNRLASTLDELVADGTIDSAQQEAILAKMEDSSSRADRACAGIALVRSAGVGEAVRDLLGMDRREIAQAWRDGQSLAEMATAKGIERQQLVDTIIGALDTRLSEAVESGRISEERKAEILASARERIETGIDVHQGELRDRAATSEATPAP